MKRYKEYLFGVVEDSKGKYILFDDCIKMLQESKDKNDKLRKTLDEVEYSLNKEMSLNKKLNNENNKLMKLYDVIGLLMAVVMTEAIIIYGFVL